MNYVDTAEPRDGDLGGNNNDRKDLSGIRRILTVMGRIRR